MGCFATKIKNLLDESPEAYYWAGFICADGSFDKLTRLKIGLSSKDKLHLCKFANFIGLDIKYIKFRAKTKSNHLSVMSKIIISKFMKKFDLKQRKTYNPPGLNKLYNHLLFICFIIGFIDGDGSIRRQNGRKDCFLTIKCYKSWFNNLQLISNHVCESCNLLPNIAKINNTGYAEITFSNNIILKFLKRQTINYNLPILERKWCDINLNWESRQEIGKQRKIQVYQLLSLGWRKTDIASHLGIAKSSVSNILKRNLEDNVCPINPGGTV